MQEAERAHYGGILGGVSGLIRRELAILDLPAAAGRLRDGQWWAGLTLPSRNARPPTGRFPKSRQLGQWAPADVPVLSERIRRPLAHRAFPSHRPRRARTVGPG